jgi:hypothetical protein
MPEAFLRQTGRPSSLKLLSQHLRYISRDGALPLETPEEQEILGRVEIDDLGRDWTFIAVDESRRRSDAPLARAFVLGAPPGSELEATRRASRAFARERFGGTFDYAFVLHDDKPYPHAHLIVRALGRQGERLNLGPAMAQAWREHFAEKLRAEGVAAQATLAWERGQTSLPEPFGLRKMRERHERDGGPCPEVVKHAYSELAQIISDDRVAAAPAQSRAIARRRTTQAQLVQTAELLQQSADPNDRLLGEAVARYAAGLPTPTSRRILLAQKLRQTWEAEVRHSGERQPVPRPTREFKRDLGRDR